MPSGRVVVATTSSGRAFEVARVGCYTENCPYTGTASRSNAVKGPCTDMAGYLSDTEIKAILESVNVNQSFVDDKSNTNIIVYNNTQWVARMSPQTEDFRRAVYRGLNMGGTAELASGLQDISPASSYWSNVTLNVHSGPDPYTVGSRTGNWTSVSCTDPAVEDIRHLTPGQRWAQMDGNDAWKDVIEVWTQYDRPAGRLSFTQSISDTIHAPELAQCSVLLDTSNCLQTLQCDGFDGAGSGAAGYEIWNSFVVIHEVRGHRAVTASQPEADCKRNMADVQQLLLCPVSSRSGRDWLRTEGFRE